jgi:hypothetical protein
MTDHTEARRAAVTCVNCGEVQVSHVHPNGTIEPLGRSSICDCDDPKLQIMNGDDPADQMTDQ